jgi:hypothetical protein
MTRQCCRLWLYHATKTSVYTCSATPSPCADFVYNTEENQQQ